MSKIFACGGLKIRFYKEIQIKIGQIWLKSRPKGAKFFWDEKIAIFRKRIKKHCEAPNRGPASTEYGQEVKCRTNRSNGVLHRAVRSRRH